MAFFEAGLFIPNTAIPTTLKHGYLTHIMGGNCRMAKHIQCVQTIQNCMKKVKSEYHNVPPLRPSVVPIPRNLPQNHLFHALLTYQKLQAPYHNVTLKLTIETKTQARRLNLPIFEIKLLENISCRPFSSG